MYSLLLSTKLDVGRMLVDSLFALVVITGLVDADRLAAVADSFNVDRRVVFAVAWMETRDGRRWNALGPGKVVIDAPIDTLLKYSGTSMKQVMLAPFTRRVCREVGRFQLRSCVDWTKPLKDRQCTTERLRLDYATGIHCGVKHLADLHRQFGSWREVIRRQNGRGPAARKYVERAVAYIGRISLKARNGGIWIRRGPRFLAPGEVVKPFSVDAWTARVRVLGVAVAVDCGRVVRRSPESDPRRLRRFFASDRQVREHELLGALLRMKLEPVVVAPGLLSHLTHGAGSDVAFVNDFADPPKRERHAFSRGTGQALGRRLTMDATT